MANCSAGPSHCKVSCTGGCGCVYVHDTNECVCECFDDVGTTNGKLGLRAVVSVSVSGLSLGQFAARLDRLLVREVLVPAARAGEKVNLRLRRVPMGDAIKALRLSTRVAAKTPSRPGRKAAR
jgi:hypothetical protein